MSPLRVVGVILIVLGILGLAYERFSFTRETDSAELGPVELEIKDRETVAIPSWASIGAIVVGGVMLLGAGTRKT
jgi:hypothetical protein